MRVAQLLGANALMLVAGVGVLPWLGVAPSWRMLWRRIGLAYFCGILVTAITGWVLALLVVPAAAFGLPWLLSAPRPDIAQLEALQEWTRALAGVLGSRELVGLFPAATRPSEGLVTDGVLVLLAANWYPALRVQFGEPPVSPWTTITFVFGPRS